jgi:hypothetical protein
VRLCAMELDVMKPTTRALSMVGMVVGVIVAAI